MIHELIITVFEASLSDSSDIQFDKQHGLYSFLVSKKIIQSKIKKYCLPIDHTKAKINFLRFEYENFLYKVNHFL